MFSKHPKHPLLRFLLLLSLLLGSESALAQQGEDDSETEEEETQAPDGANKAPGVVNLNEATLEELMRLPGVGPAKAAAILKVRERIKRFPRLAALMRVKGIGRKTFAKLRPMLTLEGPTTLQPGTARTAPRTP